MKKMFIFVMALAMCVSAMATQTAIVQVKLTGVTGGLSNSVYLVEDDGYTSAYESGADVEKIMDQANSNSVLMYGFVGTTPCGYVVTDNLDGLNLGLKTNQVDANYTLTFKNVSGRALTLYDRLEDVSTDITNNGTYNFSVDPAQVGQVAINDRFYINLNASDFTISVTTNADGLATFSHASALAPVEAGVKLYKGAVNGEYLDLTQVNDIAAAQGVIVYGEANTTYHFNMINGATSDFTGNELKAASTWAYPHAGYNAYVLSGSSLYLYEGENMKPNKAFLLLSAGSGAPRRISLRFDQTTAIDNVAAENVKAEKVVENGQIFIRRGNEVYNLQGQLVK